jgi:hypothetical protein
MNLTSPQGANARLRPWREYLKNPLFLRVKTFFTAFGQDRSRKAA